jgi:DNA repair protein RecN (Recombination protein N)
MGTPCDVPDPKTIMLSAIAVDSQTSFIRCGPDGAARGARSEASAKGTEPDESSSLWIFLSIATGDAKLRCHPWHKGQIRNYGGMLSTLRIKNLALVADLTLDLQPGYNVITGETGAGKSILIGALNLVLGGRADRNLIRSGTDACTVEAVFLAEALGEWLPGFLAENGLEPCEAGLLVLKRTSTLAGGNRQFVNGSPTQLNTLGTIGDRLVDIHGPHDHQSLLHPVRQLDILDAFGGLESLRATFAGLVRERATLLGRKAGLIIDEQSYARQLELLRHQVREIDDARLGTDEEEQLEQEHQRASNAARLTELSRQALGLLNDDEDSLLSRAGLLGRMLLELQRIDLDTGSLTALHEEAVGCLRELEGALSRYADRIDLDSERLRDLEERLNLIQSLKRKYGQRLADVIAFGDQARQQLKDLEGREVELERLEGQRDQIEAELLRLGGELHARRRKLLPRLQKSVVSQLADLGFRQCRFEVGFATNLPVERTQLTTSLAATGFDTIEFGFAPNPGEPARPLRAIASSGELARVMLALKTVLAVQDAIPVLVFDEVDANVGGETAHTVGSKMREIGRHRQVVCITHLAPVAACANYHVVVTKETQGERTITDLRSIEGDDRVGELARMLGGGSDAARHHAEALLKSGASARGATRRG